MHAFVLDRHRKPLTPCRMARARILLSQGKAAVFRCYPFTIILTDRTAEESAVRQHRVKIDPGSKTTGIAIVQGKTRKVVFAAELEHRGQKIKASLDSRRASRRGRRARKTRYRKPRFDNRARPRGWMPPSLESRVANTLSWVERLRRSCTITAISQELVQFDLQQIENPEIAGMEYQQGTLAGYELREYLLEKWDRRCAYCGKTGVPLQIEHILARTNGGTDCVGNLALACELCNLAKGRRSIEDFLAAKPDVLVKIQRQAKAPLKDATAVNATRWDLYRRLAATGLPVECGSGGRTKSNRIGQGFPKAHWIDAACVGVSGQATRLDPSQAILVITAMGRGKRQICRTDPFGFPIRWCPRTKKVQGFQTGDIVRAKIPSGKYIGTHVGRVAVRTTGWFQIGSVVANVRHVRMVQRVNGYQYQMRSAAPPHA